MLPEQTVQKNSLRQQTLLGQRSTKGGQVKAYGKTALGAFSPKAKLYFWTGLRRVRAIEFFFLTVLLWVKQHRISDCTGAQPWPLAVPLWTPWPDSSDPLHVSPVSCLRLFWFWSTPKLSACPIHRRGGEKTASLRADADLAWLSYQEAPTKQAPRWRQRGFPAEVVGEKTTRLWEMYLQSEAPKRQWWPLMRKRKLGES